MDLRDTADDRGGRNPSVVLHEEPADEVDRVVTKSDLRHDALCSHSLKAARATKCQIRGRRTGRDEGPHSAQETALAARAQARVVRSITSEVGRRGVVALASA